MNRLWLKYTLHLPANVEEAFVACVLESTYTFGWTEPSIEVLLTENGYDYQERTDLPLTAYLFEPFTGSMPLHQEALAGFLSAWDGRIQLLKSELVEEEDDSWKETYQEVIVDPWVIAPSWIGTEQLPLEKRLMRIDPGAAFGTGYHGTTQDILRELQSLDLTGKRVLDVGTGSGILAIFAVLSGASQPVHAVDINPDARWEVRHNLELNQLPESAVTVWVGDPLDSPLSGQLPEQADLILINIGGEEDIAMLPLAERRLAPGGILILSGIVEWIREKVESAYRQAGFRLQSARQSGEWVTQVWQR